MNLTLHLKQMIQHPFYKKKVYYFNKTDLHFVILTVCYFVHFVILTVCYFVHFVILTVCYFENECLQVPRDFSVEPYPVPWHKSIQRRTHRRQTMSHLDPVKEDNNRWRLKDESDIWSLVLLNRKAGRTYLHSPLQVLYSF